MKVVIDISQEDFNSICYFEGLYFIGHDKLDECVTKAFQSAMILPEGHGDLIDRDELKTHKYHDSDRYENAVAVAQIDWAPVVIPADKENEK